MLGVAKKKQTNTASNYSVWFELTAQLLLGLSDAPLGHLLALAPAVGPRRWVLRPADILADEARPRRRCAASVAFFASCEFLHAVKREIEPELDRDRRQRHRAVVTARRIAAVEPHPVIHLLVHELADGRTGPAHDAVAFAVDRLPVASSPWVYGSSTVLSESFRSVLRVLRKL
jgi:hypothetical protein